MQSAKSTLKHERLTEEMRRRIAQGELRVDDRLPSFQEMREEFGATPTTVDRVYSALERDGLVRRRRGLGIFVATPPTRKTTGIIGVYFSVLSGPHPYFNYLLTGIQEVVRREKMELLLLDAHSDVRWEKVDGVLDCNTSAHIEHPSGNKRMLRNLPPGMPYVSVISPVKDEVSVVTNDMDMMAEATEYLLSLGHKRIACITNFYSKLTRRRVSGYREAMESAGLFDERLLRRNDMSETKSYREGGAKTMKSWLNEDWRELGCTAIVALNDDTAIGVMQTLIEAGIRVPDDVSVVGFDGTEIGELCAPTLTSVRVPLHEMGVHGMELLLRKIREQPVEVATLEIPAKLIVRQSTAPLAT